MAEHELDPYDRLVDACRNASQYPYTLLKRNVSRAVISGYYNHLAQNDAALFDSSRQRLILWEAWPGGQSFHMTKIGSTKELAEHLIRDGTDPRCRHIFIESENSRAPLNCSSDMLKTILTYHQVNPSFLDSIFAFGDQDEPLDAGLAYFHSDDTLPIQERLPFLDRLGRSGREIRHSFLLRSVERAEHTTDPWSIRQVAVYHSFDVLSGRAVWITVKGNDLLQRMIMEDSKYLPVYQGAIGTDVGAAFEASLATYLMFFRWCEQNWRWYVRDMEDRIRGSLVRAKTIPVESEPHFARFPQKTETGISTSSKGSALKAAAVFEKQGVLESISKLNKFRRRALPATMDPIQPLASQGEPALPNARRVPEGILVLNMFNYKDLQKLSILAERLEEAVLILQLDIGVLQDIYEYFQGLPRSDDITSPFKAQGDLAKSVSTFLRKLRQIIRSLETRQAQLVSLRKRLDSGKGLYENLLQLRSLQVSRIFAEHGHRSAINMENIARRTERETVSMHTITIVTLVFLPATFLGTFFQSGVFEWAERPEITGEWLFRTSVFELFMAICVPMTVLTLLGWLVVNTIAKIRARRKLSEDTTQAEAITRIQGLSV